MSKQRKEEKQNIKLMVDEIDNTLFGNSRKPITKHKIDIENMVWSALVGFTCGCGGLVCSLLPSAFLTHDENMTMLTEIVQPPIGAMIGIIVYLINNQKLNYNDYEKAYLYLPRDKQLEVLNLAKKLVYYYKRNIQTKKSEKYVEDYLNLVGNSNMFDKFDNEHPQFNLLEQSQIDDIHSRGKVTPYEQYLVWEQNSYCPNLECDKTKDCRDCLVECANLYDEWDLELDNTATTNYIKKKIMDF